MLKSFAQDLIAEGLLRPNESLVIGVSGGPDSMALLHLLSNLNKTKPWNLKLCVAHLNHQLRPDEAESDAVFVQTSAESLGIPCMMDSRDVRTLAAVKSVSLEEAGRQERYAFFERACLQFGASAIAVGHHADDNAETILHRVFRGTGLRGLAGIPRERPLSQGSDIRLIRPLLKTTRKTLLHYLADEGVAFREDRSNQFNEPTRNRIRNVVIPALENNFNPQVREALTRLAEQATWVQDFLSETVERTFGTLIVSHTDQVLTINADALARKSRIVQAEIIRMAYRSFGLGEQDLAFSHLVSAMELITDSTSGRKTQLPQGMTVEKRYHLLVFTLPSDEPKESIAAEIAIHVPGQTILPIRRLEIECSIQKTNASQVAQLRRKAGALQEFVDLDAIREPLVVRTRRPGDRFMPLGAPGSKKISDFLTSEKVEPAQRKKVALLCDQLGPIWVIGHRIDDRVKLTELTKRALCLRARSLDA